MRPSLVPPEVLDRLNEGAEETVNLMEVIAVDQARLRATLFPNAADDAPALESDRLLERMVAGADAVIAEMGPDLWAAASSWRSDIARGWAAMAVGRIPGLSIGRRLNLARPFALDRHFAVREWAWLGVRDAIIKDLAAALEELVGFASDPSALARRFASEATRPIGVWSRHITTLRQDPARAEPLLHHLHTDPARYVQLSVGNWLNDASRDNPEWVRTLCNEWSLEDQSPLVYQRALRTITRGRE